jgi:hypothetical protein
MSTRVSILSFHCYHYLPSNLFSRFNSSDSLSAGFCSITVFNRRGILFRGANSHILPCLMQWEQGDFLSHFTLRRRQLAQLGFGNWPGFRPVDVEETSIGLPGLALEADVLMFSDSMEHHLRVFDDGQTDQIESLHWKSWGGGRYFLRPWDNH